MECARLASKPPCCWIFFGGWLSNSHLSARLKLAPDNRPRSMPLLSARVTVDCFAQRRFELAVLAESSNRAAFLSGCPLDGMRRPTSFSAVGRPSTEELNVCFTIRAGESSGPGKSHFETISGGERRVQNRRKDRPRHNFSHRRHSLIVVACNSLVPQGNRQGGSALLQGPRLNIFARKVSLRFKKAMRRPSPSELDEREEP